MFLLVFWNIKLSVCVWVCVCVCVRDKLNCTDICEILQGLAKSYFWYYFHAFQL
jgi:hypothetical protein